MYELELALDSSASVLEPQTRPLRSCVKKKGEAQKPKLRGVLSFSKAHQKGSLKETARWAAGTEFLEPTVLAPLAHGNGHRACTSLTRRDPEILLGNGKAPQSGCGCGSKPRLSPSEHPNPHSNRRKWVLHLPQNGTIGFDPWPCRFSFRCPFGPSC